MNIWEALHQKHHMSGRVTRLSVHLLNLIRAEEGVPLKLLDVGCGDGGIARSLMETNPALHIEGVDVMKWDSALIPVQVFDGKTLPFPDKSFDGVLIVDVLHHTENARGLLAEAKRVAKRFLIIKDHLKEGALAYQTLRFMDFIANRRIGMALPYLYWTYAQWIQAFEALELKRDGWIEKLGLYPIPADWIFGRRLHFMSRLEIT